MHVHWCGIRVGLETAPVCRSKQLGRNGMKSEGTGGLAELSKSSFAGMGCVVSALRRHLDMRASDAPRRAAAACCHQQLNVVAVEAAPLRGYIASALASVVPLCMLSTERDECQVGGDGGCRINNKQPCAAAFLVRCCATLGSRFVFALYVQPPPPPSAFKARIDPQNPCSQCCACWCRGHALYSRSC